MGSKPHRLLVPAIILSLLSLTPSSVFAQSDADEVLTKRFDDVLQKSFRPDQPGGAVIVVHKGRTIYKSAVGTANLELNVPLDPDMIFRIGSITKQFTAAAIMMLVEEGKLSLDDQITKFLPDYPTQGTKITVTHLLNHTSGIRSYTGIPGWMETTIRKDLELTELIDGFKNEPMDFAPGEKFRYNNSGYVLLGAIIEKVSGMTYADFIEQRIFEPLEMKSSFYDDQDRIIPNRATGYDGTKANPQNSQRFSSSQPYAAGSIISNVQDLATWNHALFSNKVVSAESLSKMIAKSTLNNGKKVNYGFGLSNGKLRGHRMIQHGGGIFGFVTQGNWFPDDEIYVAVLCNATFQNPELVANRLSVVAFGDTASKFKKIELDEKTLKRYTGVYKIDDSRRCFVYLDQGALKTRQTGGGIFTMMPHSDSGFYSEDSSNRISFEMEEGEVTGVRLFGGNNGKGTVAQRLDEPLPTFAAAGQIDTSVYDDYVGVYEVMPKTGVKFVVSRDGDRLMVQPPGGQEAVQVLPISQTVFAIDNVDGELTFVRGSNNKVDSIQLVMRGSVIPLKRKSEEP